MRAWRIQATNSAEGGGGFSASYTCGVADADAPLTEIERMTEGLVETAELGAATAAGRTGVVVAGEGFVAAAETVEAARAGWTTTEPAEGSPGMMGFVEGAA